MFAAVALAAGVAHGGVPEKERTRKRVVNQAIKHVSEQLGNTPAVARGAYIDPRVLERFDEGRTVLPAVRELGNGAVIPQLTDDRIRAELDRAVTLLITG